MRGLGKRQLVPALAFAVPIAAIAFTQYRWLGEVHSQSRMIESQNNRAAATAAIGMLQSEMNAARQDFLPGVDHGNVIGKNLDKLAPEFDEAHRLYGYIDHFFLWVAPDALEDTLFYLPGERRFGPAPDLLARFPQQVFRRRTESHPYGEYRAEGAGPPLQIVVHRVVDLEDADREGVLGIIVDIDRFARETLPSFLRDRIQPMLREDSHDEPVAFLGESGQCLLGVPSCFEPEGLGASIEFPASFGMPTERIAGAESPPLWRFVVAEPQGGLHQGLRRSALANVAIVAAGILVLAIGAGLIARSFTREAELSDLKSRFISGISHELKTPLSLLRLYSEMLELGRVKESERMEFYRRLRQQSEALGDMLEEVLDFSRLEAEQQLSPRQICSPREIAQEAIDMLTAHGASPRKVTLEVGPDLPRVEADRRGLVRAVYNLLDNAAKYGAPDQPIEVRAERRNGSVALEVRDRGNGIEESEIARIFERFYRGNAARVTSVKGTGLGLSIAESVVKAHAGRIVVETAPGTGSTFTILLPVTGA
ncbi:MAG TPA: HAMP domain-containing sensor histidine kinase [Vicinamibacteria bacterium]|nr:HAMP domain-containing sensor histidine kinase [Vicinamibacteria bacterium]